jgi:hypothetical protein
VSGRALLTITLHVVNDGAAVKLTAGVATLNDCLSLVWTRIVDDTGVIASLSKLPDAAAHRGLDNAPLFCVSPSHVAANPAGALRTCSICSKNLASPEAALSHAAYHAIAQPGTLPHSEMCPLCNGPASGCPPYVYKNATAQPRVLCSTWAPGATAANLDRAVKFQSASLAKSTKSNPSTNRPIVCPLCHPDLAEQAHTSTPAASSGKRKDKVRPAVWSYNMRAHWLRLHSSSAMPLGLSRAIELAVGEASLIKGHRG